MINVLVERMESHFTFFHELAELLFDFGDFRVAASPLLNVSLGCKDRPLVSEFFVEKFVLYCSVKEELPYCRKLILSRIFKTSHLELVLCDIIVCSRDIVKSVD